MRMRIYFCDLCNESVPQADLDQKRAAMRNGRVVCARCEGAMSGAVATDEGSGMAPERLASVTPTISDAPRATLTPVALRATSAAAPVGVGHSAGATPGPRVDGSQAAAPRRSSAGVAVAVSLALVALILASAGAAFSVQQREIDRRELDGELVALRAAVDVQLAESESRSQGRVAETVVALGATSTRIDELDEKLAVSGRGASAEGEALRGELAALSGRLDALDRMVGDAQRRDTEFARIGETVAGLHAEVLRLTDRLHEVESGAAMSAQTPTSTDSRPDWWPLVGDLSSQNSGARWGAVQALGETHDPAVAEYLAPMLKDPDIFVRMATARVLGDLRAVIGIPSLIDALEDAEASVREAAVVSLREISGRDFRFDPSAKESERRKRVKAWRDWWDKASEDLLGGSVRGA